MPTTDTMVRAPSKLLVGRPLYSFLHTLILVTKQKLHPFQHTEAEEVGSALITVSHGENHSRDLLQAGTASIMVCTMGLT